VSMHRGVFVLFFNENIENKLKKRKKMKKEFEQERNDKKKN